MGQTGVWGGLHALSQAAMTAVEQLAGKAANPVPAEWTHVTKVDPEPAKRLPLLFPVYLAHTSAVSVGGSRDVTAGNTEATFEALRYAPVPTLHEPSGPSHVTPTTRAAADLLAVPEVLNGDTEALVGSLGRGIENLQREQVPQVLDRLLPGALPAPVRRGLETLLPSVILDRAVFEAYLIQNPESAAAREAGVTAADCLDPGGARRRALAADRHLRSEIVYLEYSGRYGGQEATDLIEAVAPVLNWSRLWYGGGLRTADQVAAVRDAGADTVVVGDVFHDIATEERRLCQAAVADAVGDLTHPAVIDWVRDQVDLETAAATQYLATVGVADPEPRAESYLATAVQLWLGLRGVDLDDPAGDRTAVDAVCEACPLLQQLISQGAHRYVTALLAGMDQPPDVATAEATIPSAQLSIAGLSRANSSP